MEREGEGKEGESERAVTASPLHLAHIPSHTDGARLNVGRFGVVSAAAAVVAAAADRFVAAACTVQQRVLVSILDSFF